MARFCLSPGCPEIIEAKSGWCTAHDPWLAKGPWANRVTTRDRGSGWAWGYLRRRVLRRDDYRCQEVVNGKPCGAQATEVDHIVPVARCLERGINADDLGNLRSLCPTHHEAKTHADREEGKRLSREIKKGRR